MENKLYYQDSYIRTFSTKLKKQLMDESGKWYAVLEETAFYPTGGGQPFDTGTLNNIRVVEVEEIDGEIRHYLNIPIPEEVEVIEGEIDWNRRFDHMQQHAGQHILSAAFEELYSYTTVGFHLGQEILTIDLDVEELTEEHAANAEKLANQIILENRPIQTKWVTQSELSSYPLRKQPTVTENIRLVIIPEYDYNGCGGTHPNSTGQVGSIKILDWEKQKKKTRIQFICGNRVLKHLHKKQKVILELTKLLNAPEAEMVAAITRIIENAKSTEKQLEDARKVLLEFEAKELMKEFSFNKEKKILCKVIENHSIKELQFLAKKITNETDEIIVFLVSENGSQLQLVAARGAGIQTSMKELISELLPIINGKGGGNDSFSQGGGEKVLSGKELLNHFMIVLNNNKDA